MHPKDYWTFAVSDDEKMRAGEAIAWLDSELQELFASFIAALHTKR
jgi:hypothetical protein